MKQKRWREAAGGGGGGSTKPRLDPPLLGHSSVPWVDTPPEKMGLGVCGLLPLPYIYIYLRPKSVNFSLTMA